MFESMKQSLIKAAETLAKGRARAYVSRVAWLDLEKMIKAAYDELEVYVDQKAELGYLFLTSNRNYPPLNEFHLNAIDVLNQIQISAGWRQLKVSRAVTENNKTKIEHLAEGGATLWYSQNGLAQ